MLGGQVTNLRTQHFLLIYFFLAIISVTPAKMAMMPMPNCSEKVSPKTKAPMMTAVTGSRLP